MRTCSKTCAQSHVLFTNTMLVCMPLPAVPEARTSNLMLFIHFYVVLNSYNACLSCVNVGLSCGGSWPWSVFLRLRATGAPLMSKLDFLPMKSEPPTPTRAPDSQSRKMQGWLNFIRNASLLNSWGRGRGFRFHR